MLARLNADGSFDTGFPLAVANGTITALAAQSDGKIVIAGDFNNANGTGRNGVARLNEDGSLDDTFDTGGGISGVIAPRGGRSVAAAAIQEDGQIIIVGRFTSVNGIRRNGIARLNGNPPLRFVPTRPLVNGAFRLTLATQPGNTYVLQSSIDLLNWIPVNTNIASGFWLEFEDANAAGVRQRFYRAVLPSP